ncbi:hypothetical protein PR202_ga26566 [Eleusine coracana subsp. coracana]|uniref:Uncharacterized protein n=1 Tax=Eleusine coracana subsp. coracana TaxID=191504 RepID=A0AAV5DC94_ELECO|nr:hypothetical protein PR202_ga26566 [Eleusine coracana subsp. coracana]
MASITLLSLAPTATFLHIPASTSSSFTVAPGPLNSRRAAPRPLALRARPPRRVTVCLQRRRGGGRGLGRRAR